MLGKRTLVKLDIEGYSKLAKTTELIADAKSVLTLNRKIRGFAEEALQKVSHTSGYIIESLPSSDSVLVHFEEPNEAHKFAISVHDITHLVNVTRPDSLKLMFRIGCSTGIIDLEEYAGNTNTVAFRLEAGGEAGGILIDIETYKELSPEFQKQYETDEIIRDKNNEQFIARRWLGSLNSDNRLNFFGVITNTLETQQFPNSSAYPFVAITLDKEAKVIRRKPKTARYLVQLIDSQELRMIAIPSGEYFMGSSNRGASEKPQHDVKVSTFLMSQYPITKAQWEIVAKWPSVNQELKKRPSPKGSVNSPIVKISWNDAIEFCKRLSQKTGNIYRLPTEAEWEYACRSGTTTPFHFGETISTEYANYDGTRRYSSEAKGIYREQIMPVNEFKSPNHFGLFDMHGNVWEWCLDHWHDSYEQAPTHSQAWINEGESRRIIRGGSWRNEPASCTSTYRMASDEKCGTSNNVGFRIVQDII
jgi:formylglycine-generating enzyme required for sulfatase activity